ncbi:hypothetical protein ASE86_05170 [Sphingomonas sp. Leaf33]|uniref:GGDEF domain-containing protein n=1 Tax=Sphingomonas sp. Leaf33 TaxID=1736215 RepID=UPI0006FDC58D|nr:diguanylate cyclase [Sphingomonas sp. Leaf33]KQN25607.1 hypothetical protein ASE86_05170 [Sphingomonas sp. Leaf33]
MWGWGLLRALGVVLAMAAACIAQPAFAQAGLAGTPIGACVTRVQPRDTPAALFAAAHRFDCTTRQTDFGRGDYWVRSDPIPARETRDGPVRARIGSLWQAGLSLHVLYADGSIAALHRTSKTLSHDVELGAIIEMDVPQRAAPPVRLLWRVTRAENIRGIVIGQRIATAGESARANMTMAAVYAGFGGLALALLIYNLSLWWALRYRFQAAYCTMVTLLVAYAVTSSGLLAWLVPAIDNNDRIRLNLILLGLTAAAAILFARSFFERRVFAGWMTPASWASVALLAGSGPIFALASMIDMRFADRTASLMIITGLTITGPILWRAWQRGSRYLLLFSIAWALPLASAVARLLSALRVLPVSFWLDNSTILTMAFEALASSLAIAYRIQALSRERDEAMAAELRARALADTDPLTGLLNRRAFLDRAIGRPGRSTLLLIDIDHFKLVNDTLGHDGGDDVLRVFARTLHALVASSDGLVARLGGEEFGIIVPAIGRLEPEMVLDALREARMPFDLRVTASIGCCTGTLESEAQWKALYRIADRTLFDAKRAGRDRARIAPALSVAA